MSLIKATITVHKSHLTIVMQNVKKNITYSIGNRGITTGAYLDYHPGDTFWLPPPDCDSSKRRQVLTFGNREAAVAEAEWIAAALREVNRHYAATD